MPVYRCEWCGRFYSSPQPEGSACQDHIPEHNARLTADIERFNSRLARRTAQPPTLGQRPHGERVETIKTKALHPAPETGQ
jgi:hypothetical protein